jgi:hypothetical protein
MKRRPCTFRQETFDCLSCPQSQTGVSLHGPLFRCLHEIYELCGQLPNPENGRNVLCDSAEEPIEEEAICEMEERNNIVE